jgi:hypothetical protein
MLDHEEELIVDVARVGKLVEVGSWGCHFLLRVQIHHCSLKRVLNRSRELIPELMLLSMFI